MLGRPRHPGQLRPFMSGNENSNSTVCTVQHAVSPRDEHVESKHPVAVARSRKTVIPLFYVHRMDQFPCFSTQEHFVFLAGIAPVVVLGSELDRVAHCSLRGTETRFVSTAGLIARSQGWRQSHPCFCSSRPDCSTTWS